MNETDSMDATLQPGRERRLKVWLIASLALNLLVIGAVAGSMMMQHRPGAWRGAAGGPGGDGFGLMNFTKSLPAERRSEIRKALAVARRGMKPLKDEFRAARSAPADVLAAEPFDRETFKAAFGKVDEVEAKLKSAGRDALLGAIEKLTPEERRAFATKWKEQRSTRVRQRERTEEPESAPVEAGK